MTITKVFSAKDAGSPLFAAIRDFESLSPQGNYLENTGNGAYGAYQMGKAALFAIGAIKSGTSDLSDNTQWVSPTYGTSLSDFLNHSALQDAAAASYLNYEVKTLNKSSANAVGSTFTDSSGHVTPITQDGFLLSGWNSLSQAVGFANHVTAKQPVPGSAQDINQITRFQAGAIIDGNPISFAQSKATTIATSVADYETALTHSVLGVSSNTLHGSITKAGGYTLTQVSLVEGKTYGFDLTGAAHAGGTLASGLVKILNSNGGAVNYGTGSATNDVDSHLSYTSPTTGTYFVEIIAGAGKTGTYTLTAAPLDDYSDALSTTGLLVSGTTKHANIETTGDADLFKVTLDAGKTYGFDLTGAAHGGGTLSNGQVRIFNSNGGALNYSIGSGTNDADSHLSYTPAIGGTYYVQLASTAAGQKGSYTLTASPLDDYASTITTTGVLISGTAKHANIETIGDADLFKVTLVAGKTYGFDLTGAAHGGGTLANGQVRIFDSNGGALNYSIGSGTNDADSHLTYTSATGGTYFVKVASTGVEQKGSYTLTASPLDDYANAITTTGVLISGTTKHANIETAGDADLFKVTLDAGKTYGFDLTALAHAGGTLANGQVRIFNSNGGALNYGIGSGTTTADSHLSYTSATGGTYFVQVSSTGAGQKGSYTLTASPLDDYADAITTTGVLSSGVVKHGNIETIGDGDFFKVTLDAGKIYGFDLTGLAHGGGSLANGQVRIFNSNGGALNYSIGSGTNNADSHLSYTSAAGGTYFVEVSSTGVEKTGSYTLSETTQSAAKVTQSLLAADRSIDVGSHSTQAEHAPSILSSLANSQAMSEQQAGDGVIHHSEAMDGLLGHDLMMSAHVDHFLF